MFDHEYATLIKIVLFFLRNFYVKKQLWAISKIDYGKICQAWSIHVQDNGKLFHNGNQWDFNRQMILWVSLTLLVDLSLCSTNEVWLGLGNDDFNTWVDGSDVSYQNWRFEHPDDFQCVIMINSGGPNTEKWRKVSCRHTKHYFCVKQPSKSQSS